MAQVVSHRDDSSFSTHGRQLSAHTITKTCLESRQAKCKQSLQVLRVNTQRIPCAPTACSTDQNHTSGLTENSRQPRTRSVTEPQCRCLPLWANCKKRIKLNTTRPSKSSSSYSGFLLEAGSRVPAPVYFEQSTRLLKVCN